MAEPRAVGCRRVSTSIRPRAFWRAERAIGCSDTLMSRPCWAIRDRPGDAARSLAVGPLTHAIVLFDPVAEGVVDPFLPPAAPSGTKTVDDLVGQPDGSRYLR